MVSNADELKSREMLDDFMIQIWQQQLVFAEK